jgi:hypothetical protein
MFGQGLAVAWANNGDLLANALDNLAGSSDLISVRGRQSYFRPFTRVDDLRRRADERLRGKEQELNTELKETEHKLTELESARNDAGSGLVLTPEQQAELERFQSDPASARTCVKCDAVSISRSIGSATLKAINILLVPSLLALGALVLRCRVGGACSAAAPLRSGRGGRSHDARSMVWLAAIALIAVAAAVFVSRSPRPQHAASSACRCTRSSRPRSTT